MKVDFHNIVYIEARKNYTRLVMTDRSAMVLITLKQWEKLLPSELFCRVHRGYIVSIERIISFDNKFVYLPGMNISIGEQYRYALPSTVMIVGTESIRKEMGMDRKVIGIEVDAELLSDIEMC